MSTAIAQGRQQFMGAGLRLRAFHLADAEDDAPQPRAEAAGHKRGRPSDCLLPAASVMS
jgi:hypothetical protein